MFSANSCLTTQLQCKFIFLPIHEQSMALCMVQMSLTPIHAQSTQLYMCNLMNLSNSSDLPRYKTRIGKTRLFVTCVTHKWFMMGFLVVKQLYFLYLPVCSFTSIWTPITIKLCYVVRQQLIVQLCFGPFIWFYIPRLLVELTLHSNVSFKW